MRNLSPRDRKAAKIMFRLFVLGYLAGAWWHDTRLTGLAIFVVGYFLVDDLVDLVGNLRRKRNKEKIPS